MTTQPTLPEMTDPDDAQHVVQYREGADWWRKWKGYPADTRAECERRAEYLRRTFPQYEIRVVPNY